MVGQAYAKSSVWIGLTAAISLLVCLVLPGESHAAHIQGIAIGSKPSFVKPVSHPVAALMYHVIGEGPNDLYVTEDRFAWQMEYLSRGGYRSITAAKYIDALRRGADVPRHTVIITFDDGYADLYSKAFPIMKKYGLVGVAFVCSHTVGTPHHVSWEQLREMIAAGWEVGCHTATHPDLTKLSDERLRFEVAGSKEEIEDKLGIKVQSFCYPSGRYNSRVIRAVKDAGYSVAFTVDPRWMSPADDHLEMPRLRVNGSDAHEKFVRMLSWAPTWKHRLYSWR